MGGRTLLIWGALLGMLVAGCGSSQAHYYSPTCLERSTVVFEKRS